MRTINVRLSASDLPREMEAMRTWLDNSRYATKRFDCHKSGNIMIVSIDFIVDAEGEAFAARFDAKSGPLPPSAPGHLPPGVYGEGSQSYGGS